MGLLNNNAKAENRRIAMLYLANLMAECKGSVDLGMVLGAANLAEQLELITHKEYLVYMEEAYRLNTEYEKQRKEYYKERAAAKKAERAAKAKAAKENK